jgi:hypothetical protein
MGWTFYIFDRWDVEGKYSARWHECWTLRNSSDYLQGVSALIANYQAADAAELEKLEASACLRATRASSSATPAPRTSTAARASRGRS